MAEVRWVSDGRSMTSHVRIPTGTTAEVILPGLREEVEAGSYSFVTQLL